MNILPFKGYRYNPARINRLDDVISPPYDQFKEGLDDFLYRRHPFNIARLIMNKTTPRDTQEDNRYTRSKALLDEWIRQGVFLQDPRLSIYPYFQDYHLDGKGTLTRKGFVALGEVSPYSDKIVLPHERTLSKPKEDRLNLLRSTSADTGLVFMLYSDPEGSVEALLDSCTALSPEMEALDLQGGLNRLWKVDDEATIKRLTSMLCDRPVIIADGHHRYEVALQFRDEARSSSSADERWNLYNYKLMSFVRLESAGVTIFPIHRLVHSVAGFDEENLLTSLAEFFVLEETLAATTGKIAAAERLLASIAGRQRAGENAFALYLPSSGRLYRLGFRSQMADALPWPSDKSQAWRRLDISILQVAILGKLLGIGERQLTEQSNLEYISEFREAILAADKKGSQCVFLMNPTPIEHVRQVVEAGDILPQKSTHFHPKLMEGLVFARHVS